MSSRSVFVGCSLVVWSFSAVAAADDDWTTFGTGVQLLHRVTLDPWTVWAATVDLCAPGVRVRATPPDEAGLTVPEFGEQTGADLVINGDYFDGSFGTTGLAAGDGMFWPESADGPSWAFIAFGEYSSLLSPSDFETAKPEPWMSEVVGGLPSVVEGGSAITSYGRSFCNVRHPRTAVGLSEDGRSLIVAVVDGRSSSSIGMTCEELGELMAELGAFSAINLDGGGSSTFWTLDHGVLNDPSDGEPRTVANHLAIRLDGRNGVNACPDGEPVAVLDAGVIDAGGVDATVEQDATGVPVGDASLGPSATRERAAPSGCSVSPRASARPFVLILAVLFGCGLVARSRYRAVM